MQELVCLTGADPVTTVFESERIHGQLRSRKHAADVAKPGIAPDLKSGVLVTREFKSLRLRHLLIRN